VSNVRDPARAAASPAVTPAAPEPRAAPAATPAAPVRKHARAFPATPRQVRQARAFLAAALDGCPVADEAILCLSELASNAVLHSDSRQPGGTFTVRAEVHDGDYVWVEVEDDGGPWREPAGPDGRPHGLDIVRELTADRGRDGDPATGWVSWARLDCPPAGGRPAPGPASCSGRQ
jgi:serine/threonine-protein kinase RsbW